jgi:hypothetical protein
MLETLVLLLSLLASALVGGGVVYVLTKLTE